MVTRPVVSCCHTALQLPGMGDDVISRVSNAGDAPASTKRKLCETQQLAVQQDIMAIVPETFRRTVTMQVPRKPCKNGLCVVQRLTTLYLTCTDYQG